MPLRLGKGWSPRLAFSFQTYTFRHEDASQSRLAIPTDKAENLFVIAPQMPTIVGVIYAYTMVILRDLAGLSEARFSEKEVAGA